MIEGVIWCDCDMSAVVKDTMWCEGDMAALMRVVWCEFGGAMVLRGH